MRKMRLHLYRAAALCLAVSLTSCLSPKKKVAARFTELRSQWTTNLVHQAQLPEQTADWPSAVSLLRARLAYELAEREQMIELYKLFLGFQETRELSAQLQTEQQLAQSIEKADPLAGQVLLEQLKGRRLALEKQIVGLQGTAGD